MDGATDGGGNRRLVTRRDVLVAVGGAAAATTVGTGESAAATASLSVRIYPGPVPLWGWARNGFAGMHRDWPPPFRTATDAVATALEQIREYATADPRLESLSVDVDRGGLVRYPLSSAPSAREAAMPSLETVLEVFREQLRDRDALGGSTAHLLLCWAPFNYRVGYGGTLSPHSAVGVATADGATGDAQTVANVGATELWDSRAVTRNMAIHETVHALLSSDATASVVDTGCDHDLGTAVRTGEDGRTLEISPMATGYAGNGRFGVGTRWAGTGCVDRDEIHRADLADVDRVRYTPRLSEDTLEAVTRHLVRTLAA